MTLVELRMQYREQSDGARSTSSIQIALAERTRHFIRAIAETKVAERIASKSAV
jgi:hypothetical protein